MRERNRYIKPQCPPTISPGRGTQTVVYQELVQLLGSKLRVRIGSNAYRFQSFARVDRWDGAKWQEVWHIEPESMATRDGLYVARDVTAAEFERDRNTLLSYAERIV